MTCKVKVDGVLRIKTATDIATARLLREVARASDDGLDGDTRAAAWNLVGAASLRVGCAVEIHDHTEAELAQAARLVADKYDPPALSLSQEIFGR